jgi:hypothetical protein
MMSDKTKVHAMRVREVVDPIERERLCKHLIYFADDYRVYRQDFLLERTRPVVLRDRASRAEPRHQSYIWIRDVWLGRDSSPCAGRQNRVADVIVPQR